MKLTRLLIGLIFLYSLSGCDRKGDPINPENISADRYISLLASDNYDQQMPTLNPADIPELLEHRNNTKFIKNYPRNPISSFYHPECKLGIYILWTIESIRSVAIESEMTVMRYPSLNPILVFKSGEYLEPNDSQAHQTVAGAYYNWWASNQGKSVEEIMAIDPLVETEYRWR